MTYEFTTLPPSRLVLALTRAGEALARLDERIACSPIKNGFLERQDFGDAVSSLWVDGELVHMEDLVLHDARMDIRSPTNEIVNAHRILRSRRLIYNNFPQWPFTDQGLNLLRGKGWVQEPDETSKMAESNPEQEQDAEEDTGDEALSDELAEMDALLARSSATLDNVIHNATAKSSANDLLLLEPEIDEDAVLRQWRDLVDSCKDHPPLLQAAIILDAWGEMQVLERSPWLGRQLAAALLRGNGFAHLPALNIGIRTIPRERRRSRQQGERLCAILDGIYEAAQLGMKEHDRLLNGKNRMERRLVGRRSNSRLPDLIELVLAKPVVSTSMIVKALGTTPQGAVGLANQLELREMTGRGRFRAWGVL